MDHIGDWRPTKVEYHVEVFLIRDKGLDLKYLYLYWL
jgi:hypothetical protein